MLGFLNIFSGGALQNMSVAAMGVYPYITASIVMQLMVPLVPALQALSKEGEQGRKQINIYTHWMTVPMAFVQGYGQLIIVQSQGGITGIELTGPNALPTFSAMITMTAGTMFLVWIGELISEKGIGNGISMLIFAGIISGLPQFVAGRLYTGTGEGVIDDDRPGCAWSSGSSPTSCSSRRRSGRSRCSTRVACSDPGRMYRQSGADAHPPARSTRRA